MTRLPTDLRILNAIYERYYRTFAAYDRDDPHRDSKIFVPVDVEGIDKDLGVDGDFVFGRLYYHLENQYGYRKDDGLYVKFFALAAGDETHCINFPCMASVLADLRDDKRKHRLAKTLSIVSLIVAAIALTVSSFFDSQRSIATA